MTGTDWARFHAAHGGELDDFWGRRAHRPDYARSFHVFGRPAVLVANDQQVLAALDHSLPLFSSVPPGDYPPFRLQFTVRPLPVPMGESVDSVVDCVLYTGEGQWIAIGLGPWGQAFADLGSGHATAIIAPELAARPDLVSLTLLNTLLLNFCLGSGFGMLHASCLWRDDGRDGRALLLMAPHNSGKSTTALRLVRAGFALVSDSMVHIVPETDTTRAPLLAGFPVRRIKLRADMLEVFTDWRPLVRAERVRDETKYVLDLEQVDQTYVRTDAIRPERLTVCLLERSTGEATSWRPATGEAVAAAVMANSLFYDTPAVWRENLAAIDRLLARSRTYHLTIGRDPVALIAAVKELWERDGGWAGEAY